MREETNIWQQQMIVARTRTRERHYWEELFPSNWRAWLRSGVSGYWRQGPQCALEGGGRGREERGA